MTDNKTDNSAQLLQEAMQGVTPLKKPANCPSDLQSTRPKLPPATYKTRREAATAENKNPAAPLSSETLTPIQADQHVYYACNGVQSSQLKKLENGTLKIQDSLDLHGMTIEEAQDHIASFLSFCQHHGCRCVRIVHGKAYSNPHREATLKSHVNHWLRQLPEVLAFNSAPPKLGGSGSVLVLLKKHNPAPT